MSQRLALTPAALAPTVIGHAGFFRNFAQDWIRGAKSGCPRVESLAQLPHREW